MLYLHTRLNEMLVDVSTLSVPEPQGQTPKPKLAHVSVDILFQELYKLAIKSPEVAPPPGVKWKAWRDRSETYTAFAEYFRAQGENVLASDALSRSLELLDVQPAESNSAEKSTNLWRGLTEEQRHKRIALYLVLARNYYQCNQMEKAIRSMEAVFDLDPLHAEARASLVEWFPAKWQYVSAATWYMPHFALANGSYVTDTDWSWKTPAKCKSLAYCEEFGIGSELYCVVGR